MGMTIKEFEKRIKEIKKMKTINSKTKVYIDCYECLVFANKDNTSEIVFDINGDMILERGV